jgi:hypothetical protein
MKKEKKSKTYTIEKKKKKKKTTVSATHQEEINHNPSKLHQGNQRRWGKRKEDGEKEKMKAQLRGAFQFNMNFLRMKNLNSSITSLFDSSSSLISKITSISICIIL